MATEIENIKRLFNENKVKSNQLYELLEKTRWDHIVEGYDYIVQNVDTLLFFAPEHGEGIGVDSPCSDEKLSPMSRCLRCSLLYIKEHGKMAVKFRLVMQVAQTE